MAIIHRASDTRKILELTLSDDRMKLFARVEPQPESSALTDEELFQEVLSISPENFLDRDVISDIAAKLRTGKGCDERRVAKGVPPVEGRSGKIVWLARRFHTTPEHDDVERSFSDFFHLGLFENVKQGQEIARWYKPTEGKVGFDATGKSIASKAGKQVACKFDKSVSVKPSNKPEGYDILVSEVNGYVKDEGGKVSVQIVLEIPANVDYSIGHIDFIGSVRIRGDLHKGFNVRARGSIEILGSAFGDNVIASDESVTIRGFHHGGNKAVVYAKSGYMVSVAHHVRAEIKGDICILKEALDCSLRTSTLINSSRAVLQGGTAWCVKGIEAKSLGNSAGIATTVEIRNELEVTEEFETIQESIKKHRTAIAALELHLGPYAFNRRRVANLAGTFRDKISSLLQKYDQVKNSLSKLERQVSQMHGKHQLNEDARINVLEILNAGVTLMANAKTRTIKEPLKGPISFGIVSEEDGWNAVEFRTILPKERV